MPSHSIYENERNPRNKSDTTNEQDFVNQTFYRSQLFSKYQNISDVNFTVSYCLTPTDLMMSPKYMLWYKGISNIILTGLLPFILLAYLNFRVHKAAKSAFQTGEKLFLTTLELNTPRLVHCGRTCSSSAINVLTTNRSLNSNGNGSSIPRNAISHQNICITNGSAHDDLPRKHYNQGPGQKNKKHRQTHILFSIVVCFFVCHTVRLYLDVEELLNSEERKRVIDESVKLDTFCSGIPFGSMITNDVLHLLLQVSSSITFFIYLSFSKQFKKTSKAMLISIGRYFNLHKLWSQTVIIAGSYRYQSSINTHTTSSFRNPPMTFKRNRENRQSGALSRQTTQPDVDDEAIIKQNSIPNPPVFS